MSTPLPADARTANYTYDLVVATFELALVTVAAIVIPLLAAEHQRRRNKQSALRELASILDIVKRRLEAISEAPTLPVEGAGIELLVSRAFASDIAQVVKSQSVGEVYTALDRAVDVI